MKSSRRWLENRWRKDPSELNLAAVKKFTIRYSKAIKLEKRALNIKMTDEVANQQMELFWVVHILTVLGQPQYGNFRCDQFAANFTLKIETIQHDLDSTSSVVECVRTPQHNILSDFVGSVSLCNT